MLAVKGIGPGGGSQVVLSILIFVGLGWLFGNMRGKKRFLQDLFGCQSVMGGDSEQLL
jgi:hypothetical protein